MAMTENIPTMADLAPMIWLCTSSDENENSKIVIGPRIYKMLSYMFSIPMREKAGDGPYCFTKSEVSEIEYQLDGVGMGILEFGKIYTDTLMLLTNSPRCPYTLHTNSVFVDGKHWVYYRFILKRNIVLDCGILTT